jgi:hypothetical protein
VTLLAPFAALLVPPAALAKSAKLTPMQVEVLTPASGDVTIEGITTTVPSFKGKTPKLAFTAPNERALPPGVIVLSATRTQHAKHSTTYRTALLVFDLRSASAARAQAASENGLVQATDLPTSLIANGRATQLEGDQLVFLFTGILPSQTDDWEQRLEHGRSLERHAWMKSLFVGVQPNANVGATDTHACSALSDTVRLDSAGQSAPGLVFGSYQGPATQPWNPSVIMRVFDAFAGDCKGGLDALGAALAATIDDAGLAAGSLGNATPPAKRAPIGPEQAAAIVFGAELLDEPELAEEAEDDFVMWVLEGIYGASSDSLGAAAPDLRAHAAGTSSTAVPEAGQVTKVEVRGYYVPGHCPVKPEESVCQDNLHFQDLRPAPDGELEVVSTSQAFTLPAKESSGSNIHTFEPTDFFVQKGDYIGFSTVGGTFEVLVNQPGVTTDVFIGNDKDMNGDKVGATKTRSGQALNMRVTLQPSS